MLLNMNRDIWNTAIATMLKLRSTGDLKRERARAMSMYKLIDSHGFDMAIAGESSVVVVITPPVIE